MKSFDFKKYFEKIKNVEIDKLKLKQTSLIIIACLLFGIGFANYHPEKREDNKEFAVVENENTDMIGDVELVSSGSVVENETENEIGSEVGVALEGKNGEKGEIVENIFEEKMEGEKKSQDDYFENIRIERDSMYSKMLETYHVMLENDKLAETQKSIAVTEIERITNNQNAIMIAENLIKNKGFEDAVILANVDMVNVIVKAAVLSNEDIGKIQNIIEREFKVSLENVNISNQY